MKEYKVFYSSFIYYMFYSIQDLGVEICKYNKQSS